MCMFLPLKNYFIHFFFVMIKPKELLNTIVETYELINLKIELNELIDVIVHLAMKPLKQDKKHSLSETLRQYYVEQGIFFLDYLNELFQEFQFRSEKRLNSEDLEKIYSELCMRYEREMRLQDFREFIEIIIGMNIIVSQLNLMKSHPRLRFELNTQYYLRHSPEDLQEELVNFREELDNFYDNH